MTKRLEHTHSFLGLSLQQANDIFTQADLVIHNGADTLHLRYFKDLRKSNVGSTQTLVRLCLPRRIPIHYHLICQFRRSLQRQSIPTCLYDRQCALIPNFRWCFRAHDQPMGQTALPRASTRVVQTTSLHYMRQYRVTSRADLEEAQETAVVPNFRHCFNGTCPVEQSIHPVELCPGANGISTFTEDI